MPEFKTFLRTTIIATPIMSKNRAPNEIIRFFFIVEQFLQNSSFGINIIKRKIENRDSFIVFNFNKR
jgi:hypothetical protein